MSLQEFIKRAKIIEEDFTKNLENPKEADKKQNIFEHWDVEGTLNGERLKFDVKDLKKFNRKDLETQDTMACVEYVGVRGYYQFFQHFCLNIILEPVII